MIVLNPGKQNIENMENKSRMLPYKYSAQQNR